MKKTLLILSVATTLMMSACGSDRRDNSGSDSTMNENSTMDTATMSNDTAAMSTDTTSMGTGQTSLDSTTTTP